LLEEQRDFVECIRTGREPRVTGEAGLIALETAHRVLARIAASQVAAHQPEALARASSAAASKSATSENAEPAAPAILRGPHWDHLPQPSPLRRKEAG
jgi:hypothetical protein